MYNATKLIKYLVSMPTDIRYQFKLLNKKLIKMKYISTLMFYIKYNTNKIYLKYKKNLKKSRVITDVDTNKCKLYLLH